MATHDEMLICVQREWNGWHTAEVRLGDLQLVHWSQPPLAPRPLVHGYIACTSIIAGQLPHGCQPSDGPHWLLICVLKKHIVPSIYAEIARRADEQQIAAPLVSASSFFIRTCQFSQ